MKDLIIKKILKANGINPGDLVLVHFWGDDADKEIANQFMRGVGECGASPVLLQQSRSLNKALFEVITPDSFDQKFFNLFSSFDVVLDVFCYQPVILGYEISTKQFQLYRNYMARLFGKLMEAPKFCQIRIPTVENAKASNLEPQDYIQRMELAYDVDFDLLKEQCMRYVVSLKENDEIVIVTGNDHRLKFDLNDREWFIDAGEGDLPCGEVYIAPNEMMTHGSVYFETLRLEGDVYSKVSFNVEKGIITKASDPRLNQILSSKLAEDKTICELGFGMNPKIIDLCGDPLLDEKMVGTFHIAIGNNTMFGGKNEAKSHHDFVGFGALEVIAPTSIK